MQILLASAKIMNAETSVRVPFTSKPFYDEAARRFALELCRWTVEELMEAYHSNKNIAVENQLRFSHFFDESEKMPAILAYFGQAFKYLRAAEFSSENFAYAQEHLFITSFIYGLLRPLDLIHPYRLEGKVRLEATDDKQMFAWWRERLTDYIIDRVQADDGVLLFLSANEMKNLFDWKRVCRTIQVIQPQFMMDMGDKLKSLSVHAKTCRGAMARRVIIEQIDAMDELYDFKQDGYVYHPELGDSNNPYFVNSPDILAY